MIPLYILGMLLRYGPQHGYQIKMLLAEQLADFTDIKLPTIYYHLEKMEASGLITAEQVKEGVRPEKRVYAVSGAGQDAFARLLAQTLDMRYRPTFDADSAFFFSDSLDGAALVRALRAHAQRLEASLARIAAHRAAVVSPLPPDMRTAADLIFEHHALHYQAELRWAQESIQRLEETEHDETQGH